MDNPREMANPYLENPLLYREAVGLVIRNPTDPRLVMMGLRRRRLGTERNWQLPQGGLDDGEDPIKGLFRELLEETGLAPNDVMLEAVLPVRTSYKWLSRTFQRDNKKGQVHLWVVLRKKTDTLPDPEKAKDKEFDEFRWETMRRLVARTPSFRRPIYTVVEQQMRTRFSTLNVGKAAKPARPTRKAAKPTHKGRKAKTKKRRG